MWQAIQEFQSTTRKLLNGGMRFIARCTNYWISDLLSLDLDMPAQCAYIACMQYTLRNIPKEVDRALRQRASEAGCSLNQAALDTLGSALGLSDVVIVHRDLREFLGSWIEDSAVEHALQLQRQIDDGLWT